MDERTMNDSSQRDAEPAFDVERLSAQLRENPRSTAFAALAEALVRKGRPAEALEVCQRGLSIHPDHLAGRLALARSLLRLEKYKEAQAELLKVVKQDRGNHEGFVLLGEVLLMRGDFDRAQAILTHAHELDRADSHIVELLKRARERQSVPTSGPRSELREVHDDYTSD